MSLFNPRQILQQAKQFRDQSLTRFEAPKTSQPSRTVDPVDMSKSPLMAKLMEIRQGRKDMVKPDKPSPRYNPEHIKELAATVFGEASSNKEEMRAIIDTALNRRNQLGLDIKKVLTQKDRHGKPMYRAYGGPEYLKYLSGKLDLKGEPEKKKMLDELINELQYDNYIPSEFTNFDKAPREDATKIGEHYFRKEFQGNRKN